MVCNLCLSNTGVVNSRLNKKTNQVWRRRKCLNCMSIFTSIESVKLSNYWRIEKSNKFKEFNRDKLFLSLHKSLGHRKNSVEDATTLTNTIISKIFKLNKNNTLGADELSQIIKLSLKRFDPIAHMHYCATHLS